MKKKPLVATLLLLIFCAFFLSSSPLSTRAEVGSEVDHTDNRLNNSDKNKEAEGEVKITDATTDPNIIYSRYKDNSFDLMTKEKEGVSGLKKYIANFSGTLKNLIWEGTKGIGNINTELVKFLFDMDIVSAIRKPIQALTATIATNMLSIAGTIGISFVAVTIAIKFAGEQNFKKALGLFCMTILIFTGLAVLRNSAASDSFFNTVFTIDKAVETSMVSVNPVLGDNSVPLEQGKDGNDNYDSNKRLKGAGDMIATRVFFTNVYEPYLLANYGTSNVETIRKKKVTYDEKDYDRINLLLDNDISTEKGEEIHEKATEYEAEELGNRTIQHYNNFTNAFKMGFYLVVNLIQTVAYFVLCFVRIIIGVLQVFMIPILPFLLLYGLFMTFSNVFKNYAKAMAMTIFLKGMAGFACILFATFLSYGFQLSNTMDNPWQKILTILIYLLSPFGLYFFRTFLGSLFTGQMTLANAVGFATHPFSTQKLMRDNAKAKRKERKQRQNDAKEHRKKQLEAERKKAKERGKQELGLNQTNERKGKGRSNLRKELNQQAQKPKHRPDSKRQELQKKLEAAHEQSRTDEKNATKDLARRRQRKPLDQAAAQTGEAIRNANKELQEKQATESGNTLKGNRRRTGASSKRQSSAGSENTPATNTRRQQGQKHASDSEKATPKQGKATTPRSSARATRKVSGQRQSVSEVSPKLAGSVRHSGSSGRSSARRSPAVRQKMAAVKAVSEAVNATDAPNVEEVVETQQPITRMAKRVAPPVKANDARKVTYRKKLSQPVPVVKAKEPTESSAGQSTFSDYQKKYKSTQSSKPKTYKSTKQQIPDSMKPDPWSDG